MNPKRLTIQEMQGIAIERGGLCLSKEYVNNITKLKWQCSKGHTWEAMPRSVKHGQWCAYCKHKVLSIEEMQEIAKKHGGLCLSKEYKNNSTKLKWQCADGHTWEAVPSSVKNGKWCPYCNNNARLTIQEMQNIALQKGGACLSEKYINSKTRLKWQCSEGHIWETPANYIRSGNWCPYCANKFPLTIQEMQEIAKKHGGLCLSKEYKNNSTKLKWQCADGHTWEAEPYSIQAGHWCRYCNLNNLTENICREIFQKIFNDSFPSSRPKWLRNSRNNQMELDGYNTKLAVAFEYHGKQHYSLVTYFHGNETALNSRIADDNYKRTMCEKNGVKLIEIPYTVHVKDLYTFIIEACNKMEINIPVHENLDIREITGQYFKNELVELDKLALAHGGKLLSRSYLGVGISLKWQCAKGHIWEAKPKDIKRNHWCPYCAGKIKLTIIEMQEIAKKRGGLCLSKNYTNSKTKLKWQCAKGHIWENTPGHIKNGQWCDKCARANRKNN